MKFYGREKELSELSEIKKLSKRNSRFTVITGRRRIGKTSLVRKAMENEDYIYIFVSRVNETLLCMEAQKIITDFGIRTVGTITRFGDIIELLMIHSEKEPLTAMIDEFQDLKYVNESIFGDIQNVWDRHKDRAHINLIVSGSVYSMMTRLFENDKEPLFGRPTGKIELGPLSVKMMRTILSDHNTDYRKKDLLTFYMLTGGVPLYMELLMDAGAVDSESMIDRATSNGSPFLWEGRNILVSEFGKDHRVFFSVLQLISSGKVTRSEMEDVLGIELGMYLKLLDEEYHLIRHVSPVFSKENSRSNRWVISDMYLSFYFRFIQPNISLLESGRFDLIKRAVESSLPDYEGKVLENYFRTKISEEDMYTSIGGYWNRKGDVEIDIIVLDDICRKARIIEVKRNPEKISIGKLKEKAETLKTPLRDYTVSFEGLSEDDL